MGNSKLTTVVSAGLVLGLLSTGSAFAETEWQKHHPRRAEVNGRLNNQENRINNGVKDGQLTHPEAHQLRREDRAIRNQERRYARNHGGHISKAEKQKLNNEENAVSNQIHEERHD